MTEIASMVFTCLTHRDRGVALRTCSTHTQDDINAAAYIWPSVATWDAHLAKFDEQRRTLSAQWGCPIARTVAIFTRFRLHSRFLQRAPMWG
jgi:hypothetical protein